MNKLKLETLIREDATVGVPKEFRNKVLGWIGSLPAADFKSEPTANSLIKYENGKETEYSNRNY